MELRKGDIVNKKSFLEKGLFAKEEYEGLLVSADTTQQCYNLGIQLDEDRILVVDQVKEGNVEEKVRSWSGKIPEIQKAYGAGNDLQNYIR